MTFHRKEIKAKIANTTEVNKEKVERTVKMPHLKCDQSWGHFLVPSPDGDAKAGWLSCY